MQEPEVYSNVQPASPDESENPLNGAYPSGVAPTAAFLIGDTIKVKLKASWYDSTGLFLFSVPMRNAAIITCSKPWSASSKRFWLSFVIWLPAQISFDR